MSPTTFLIVAIFLMAVGILVAAAAPTIVKSIMRKRADKKSGRDTNIRY